ncbi:MAG: hypothetical protein Q4D64_13640 [Prevotellaceae bacterium]|nr:hypothetical protein [Prevotellaceae bacterium]
MDQHLVTLLELVRVEGIVKMLWDNIDHNALAHTVHQVLQNENENIKADLDRMTRYQLIQVADHHLDVVTADLINQYYEQYRYGLKPGFTLYLLCGPQPVLTAEQAYAQLQQQLNDIPDIPNATIRKIRCKNCMILADQMAEFSMSYLRKHSYIDEREVPRFIHEFEEFFIWINIEAQYMAIKNVPDKVSETVVNLLKGILHQGITYVKLTKPVIDAAFGTEQRKGTFLKANAADNEAEKITVADARLQEKETVLNGLASYSMTSTYLTQTMDDESRNTLGINCERGKLYLTKNLPATLFRGWSISAIQRIIPLITEEARMDDFETFKARNVIDQNEWKCSRPQAAIFEQIVYGIFNCIRSTQTNAYINVDINEVWAKTQKYWIASYAAECPSCSEATFLHCPNCHSSDIHINKSSQLFCRACGEILDRCECDEGHEFVISNSYDALRLVPTPETLELISTIFADTLLLPFDKTFQIVGNRIEVYPLSTPSLVNIVDVPELKQVHDIALTEEEYDQLHCELVKMKEKCGVSKNRNCNTCLLSDKRKCLMKIFTTYLSYRPSPHNGDELADVSFPVTVDKNLLTLVGVIKSAISDNGNLTRSSQAAREMLQQVFVMCQDSRIGLIAAICPSRFQDQFREDLQYVSKLTNKPVVVLDDLYMCKQLKAFKEGRQYP